MNIEDVIREMREREKEMFVSPVRATWADAVEQERKQLRSLLARVLAAEGRCPTRLLHDISRVLEDKQ